MAEEKILTLHPQGKKGVNISLAKYTLVSDSILAILNEQKTITFKSLCVEVDKMLHGSFEGSIMWYTVSVKLDLEARDVIERIPRTSPHEIRLKN